MLILSASFSNIQHFRLFKAANHTIWSNMYGDWVVVVAGWLSCAHILNSFS